MAGEGRLAHSPKVRALVGLPLGGSVGVGLAARFCEILRDFTAFLALFLYFSRFSFSFSRFSLLAVRV